MVKTKDIVIPNNICLLPDNLYFPVTNNALTNSNNSLTMFKQQNMNKNNMIFNIIFLKCLSENKTKIINNQEKNYLYKKHFYNGRKKI